MKYWLVTISIPVGLRAESLVQCSVNAATDFITVHKITC